MTRSKFFGFLFPLAIAGGLALGFAPALADPPPHSHGGGGTSEPEPTFTVSLSFIEVLDTGTIANDCPGTTDIQANPGLGVQLTDPDCFVLITDAPEGEDPVKFRPFALEVKTKRGSTTVRLGFTTSTQLFPVPNETVYMSDFMTATISDGPGEGVFVLTPITADGGEILTKIHQPGKGAVTLEPVKIGVFTYTPDPS